MRIELANTSNPVGNSATKPRHEKTSRFIRAIARTNQWMLYPCAHSTECGVSPVYPFRWQRSSRWFDFRCPITSSMACIGAAMSPLAKMPYVSVCAIPHSTLPSSGRSPRISFGSTNHDPSVCPENALGLSLESKTTLPTYSKCGQFDVPAIPFYTAEVVSFETNALL